MTLVAVDCAWQPVGPMQLEAGRLVFPRLVEGPGLYRLTFDWPDRARGVYIGEADDLRRRAQHYRTPGATQQTNIRMNQALVAPVLMNRPGVGEAEWSRLTPRSSLD